MGAAEVYQSTNTTVSFNKLAAWTKTKVCWEDCQKLKQVQIYRLIVQIKIWSIPWINKTSQYNLCYMTKKKSTQMCQKKKESKLIWCLKKDKGHYRHMFFRDGIGLRKLFWCSHIMINLLICGLLDVFWLKCSFALKWVKLTKIE